MRPDLIIFDCDGVLVDSEPVTDVVIARSLTGYGLPIAPEDSHKMFVGGTMAGVMRTARTMGATLPDDWLDEIYSEMFAELAKGVPLIDGLIDLLDATDAAGISKAIASNGPRRKMEVTLKPSGLWDRFAPHIHSAHDEGRPKPDPHMLHRAMTDAGARPERTIFVDDSPTGAAAGVAAGVRCLGLDPTGARIFPDGVERVASLEAVAALLSQKF